MARRHLVPITYLLSSLALLLGSWHATEAYAAPGDPPSGSPAGAVYELPLESGRVDAAPKQGGTAGGSGPGATATPDSLYRTENNFGSSAVVPGAAAGAAGAAAGALSGDSPSTDADPDRTEGAAGSPGGGSGGGSAGGEAGTADPGGIQRVAGAPVSDVGDAGNTSVLAGVILLGAIALVAVGAGAMTRRFSH